MAINNPTAVSKEKITSAKWNLLVADANNTTDNIHPQYGNSMGSVSLRPSGSGNFAATLGFRHIKNPNSKNNYKILIGQHLTQGFGTETWDIKLYDSSGSLITTITTAFAPTTAPKIDTFTFNMDAQSTGDFMIGWDINTVNLQFTTPRNLNLVKNEI